MKKIRPFTRPANIEKLVYLHKQGTMSHEELGNFFNVSREAVTMMLGKLSKQGKI